MGCSSGKSTKEIIYSKGVVLTHPSTSSLQSGLMRKPEESNNFNSDKHLDHIRSFKFVTEGQVINKKIEQEEDKENINKNIIGDNANKGAAKSLGTTNTSNLPLVKEHNFTKRDTQMSKTNTDMYLNNSELQSQLNLSIKKLAFLNERSPERSLIRRESKNKEIKLIALSEFDTILDEQEELISVNIHASRFEAMYPIWIEEGKILQFYVSGQWQADPNLEMCNSQGYEVENTDEFLHINNSFNNGALIGRILGGDYFAISNGLSFKSTSSGPLFMKMHLNNLKLFPCGTLNLRISNVRDLSFNEIDDLLGWSKEKLDISQDITDFNEEEKTLYLLINKLRTNSSLFAQQYLENIRYITNTTNTLYSNLVSFTKKLEPLSVNKALRDFSKDLVENSNSIQNNVEELQEKINGYFMKNHKEKNCQIQIKRHEDNKPLSILIKLIIDEKIRNNFLNPDISNLGLNIHITDKNIQKFNSTVLLFY
jgi:hypothetical protein